MKLILKPRHTGTYPHGKRYEMVELSTPEFPDFPLALLHVDLFASNAEPFKAIHERMYKNGETITLELTEVVK